MDPRPERRAELRLERRLPCRFELAGIEGSVPRVGMVINFTERGLRIESQDICPPGADLTVFVQAGSRLVVLLARVVWWRMEPFAHVEQMRFSAGLELLYDVPAWREYVRELRDAPPQRPAGASPRFDAVHRVSFQHEREFLTEYTQNLSQGGLYIATEAELKVGAALSLQLELPGLDTPLLLDGVVAHRLSGQQAFDRGRPPGVGVKLTALSDSTRQQLDHYLQRLNIHRSRSHRAALTTMPAAGALHDTLVPELIIAAAQHRVTGVLRLEHRGVFKSVFLREGVPIYVDSSLGSDRFGDYLVLAGKLSAAEIDRALEHGKQTGCRLGEALTALGLLSAEAIGEALVSCHEQKLYDTFSWFDGNFVFTATDEFPALVTPLSLHAEPLVFEGVRHCYDAPVVCAWTGMSRETVLALMPDVMSTPAEIDALPKDVAMVVRALQAPQTIESVLALTGQPFERLLPTVYAMILFGWLQITQAAPDAEIEALPEILDAAPESEPAAEVEELLEATPETTLEATPDEALEVEVEPLEASPAELLRQENEQKARSFAARGEEFIARGDLLGAYKQYSLATAFAPGNAQHAARLAWLTPQLNPADIAPTKPE